MYIEQERSVTATPSSSTFRYASATPVHHVSQRAPEVAHGAIEVALDAARAEPERLGHVGGRLLLDVA